jgi:hypothetical protein
MLPNRCLILASGASCKEGFSLGLINYLKKEVTFSINDNIKFIDSTVAMFGDWCAYRDRFDLFSKHPATIGRFDMHIGRSIEGATPCPKHNNLILLPSSGKYQGAEGLSKGLYSSVLTGAFTLNLACRLGFKQIFLLGFDCGAIGKSTHWYDNVEGAGQFHDYEDKATSGVGFNENGTYKTSFYNTEDNILNNLWEPFTTEDAKIYNVSLNSRINVFPKIGYHTFLTILNENPIQINQEEVQKEIHQLLEPYNKLEK